MQRSGFRQAAAKARRVLGALLLLAGLAFAGPEQAAAQMGQDYELTEEKVEALIASFPAVMELGESLRQRYDIPGGADAASWAAFMAYGNAMGELDDAVTAYGFNGFADWVEALAAAGIAMAFSGETDMDAALTEAIAEIKRTERLSDAQKQMMIDQIQGQMQSVAGVRPPQGNIDAVAAHRRELDAVLAND